MIDTVAVPVTVPVTVEVAVTVAVPDAEAPAVNTPVEGFMVISDPPVTFQVTVFAGFPVPTTAAVNCCVFADGVEPRSTITTAGVTVTEVTTVTGP